ncbi:MAG: HNH endonuclease signature motif containing protein, partial [Ilumatobacteraceae bacterium]
ANGTVITPGQLVPWLADAELETVLFDGPTTVVSVSQRRCFTGVLRRAIEVRDRHCQHPSGCDVPADGCDVDHIVPRAIHGETSQFNGRLECPTHNRHPDKHDHGATGLPPRPVTRLDELRARLRWRYQHTTHNDNNDNDGDDGDDGDGAELRDAG